MFRKDICLELFMYRIYEKFHMFYKVHFETLPVVYKQCFFFSFFFFFVI